jgi:multiple sugar transport system substrate-binding protein
MKKGILSDQLFDSRINRRQFLRTSAATFGSLCGLNYLNPPSANAAQEVNFLSWSHFIPAADVELKRQAAAFSKEKGIKLNLETIGHLQLPAKLVSQAHAKSGHDIIPLGPGAADLYQDLLCDLSALAEDLGKAYGGWHEFAKDMGMVNGKWKGIPWFYIGYPLVVRSDLMKDIGEGTIDSYDDLLRVGKKLKARGHPVGFALSHCVDSVISCHCVLWSFGGCFVAEDSKTIVIDSAETARALEYMRKLFVEAMEPEVLSWDDASNNRFILSGKGAITINSIAIYWVAKTKKMMLGNKPMAELLDHHFPPQGPAGQYSYGPTGCLGVWNFARNITGAKDFLRYHFSRENFNHWIKASGGYNMPALKEFEKNPIWDSDPKYKFVKEYGKIMRIMGWPGKSTMYAQIVTNLFIIPDMFAAVASGRKSVPEAIKWAEREIKQIYAGEKKAEPKKE